MKRVGKHGMSNSLINRICKLIIEWDGKLTWSLVIIKIEKELDFKVTRQTLNQYYSIKTEFQRRKVQIRNSDPELSKQNNSDSCVNEVALRKKIEAQQRQIESLEAKLGAQLDQMKTFIFNVRNIPGVDLSTLLIRNDRF